MLRVCNQCHRLQKYIDFHDVRRRAAHLHGNASPPVLSGVTTQERMSCVLYSVNTLSSAAALLTSCVRVCAWFVWTTKIPLINDLIIDSRPALSATATIATPPEFVHTRANHCRVHPHAPPPVSTPWQISCFECRYMRETQQTWVGMGHLHRTLVCERCERTTNWNLNLWMFLRMLVCS